MEREKSQDTISLKKYIDVCSMSVCDISQYFCTTGKVHNFKIKSSLKTEWKVKKMGMQPNILKRLDDKMWDEKLFKEGTNSFVWILLLLMLGMSWECLRSRTQESLKKCEDGRENHGGWEGPEGKKGWRSGGEYRALA